jgi:hypothetical protein
MWPCRGTGIVTLQVIFILVEIVSSEDHCVRNSSSECQQGSAETFSDESGNGHHAVICGADLTATGLD